MITYVKNNYKFFIIIGLIFLLTMGVIYILSTETLSKYIKKENYSHGLTTSQFIFESDKLAETSQNTIINNYNYEQIPITLLNGNDITSTNGNINYTLTCSSSQVTCLIDSQTTSGTLSGTITPGDKLIGGFTFTTDNNSNGILDIGDIVSLGTDRFYVISRNGNKIAALAEYNLNVGGRSTSGNNGSATAYSTTTGIQGSTMKGYTTYGVASEGVTKYGTSSNEYNSSLVKTYNDNYITKLRSKGYIDSTYTKISARAITREELIALGCTSNNYCTSAPSWVKSTTYWTSTKGTGTNYVYYMAYNGNITNANGISIDSKVGVRPVIEFEVESGKTEKVHNLNISNPSGSTSPLTVTVTATSTSPYAKTLTGTITLNTSPTGSSASYNKTLIDETNLTCSYNIENLLSSQQNITISINTTNYFVDETCSMFTSKTSAGSSGGIYNSITTRFNANEIKNLTLYKKTNSACET